MAKAAGLKKKHSPLQKEHYKSHYFRLLGNKLAKIRAHLRRNENERRKKAARTGAAYREIKLDKQALKRLEELKK